MLMKAMENKVEKGLTREFLQTMVCGRPENFPLENQRQVDVARSVASQTGRIVDGKYTVKADYELKVITIVRMS